MERNEMANIDEIMEELEEIRNSIQDAKQEKAECEGALSEQMKTLKSFGVKTVAEGKEKLKILETKITTLEKKIEAGFEKLKENYEW